MALPTFLLAAINWLPFESSISRVKRHLGRHIVYMVIDSHPDLCFVPRHRLLLEHVASALAIKHDVELVRLQLVFVETLQ